MDARLSGPRRIDGLSAHALHSVAATRRLEQQALAERPSPALMARAGLSIARLAAAWAPHAQRIWVAAGPGNNGGDGLEAAAALKSSGRDTIVTWLGSVGRMGPDLSSAHAKAVAAGCTFAQAPPENADLVLDALLGIGANRCPEGLMAQWIAHMNCMATPILAVDMPTGLDCDSGHVPGPCVRADATLSLLTLKAGLFTGRGRDVTGQVWLDNLGIDAEPLAAPTARLRGRPAQPSWRPSTHKGERGDVAVVGGAAGMVGAAWLAARSALHRGAGRVYLAALDPHSPALDPAQPELMVRSPEAIDPVRHTVVCGCGGGDAVRSVLPRLLSTARRLVLDADALNGIAVDDNLRSLLRARSSRDWATVLTPHPLEAARLADTDTASLQGDRLTWAARLADAYRCVVLLKGSGSVVSSPGQVSSIIPTGGPRLAVAGTGDVLAGAIGAYLAAGIAPFDAASDAAWLHGHCADRWPDDHSLTAGALASAHWN